jgi:TPP-dependent pyruvate/acetoin dehydrogenase alpha subunit
MADPERYRSKEEVERWRQRDPIELFAARLESASILTASDRERLEREVAAEVEAAVQEADAAPFEPVETLLEHVTTPVPR